MLDDSVSCIPQWSLVNILVTGNLEYQPSRSFDLSGSVSSQQQLTALLLTTVFGADNKRALTKWDPAVLEAALYGAAVIVIFF